jgi:hypothetical protein
LIWISILLYWNNLKTSIGVDLDDQLLFRQIFGPSEYRPFFSISAVFEVLGKGLSTFFWTHMHIQFKLRILWLCKYICLYFNVLNYNLEFLKGRGLLVVTYKMHYVGTTFTLKMNSDEKILCDNIVDKQRVNVLKWPQKFDWSRSSPTTSTSSPIWVIGISLFIPYRPSLRFQVQVPSTLYFLCVFESAIQTYIDWACWTTFKCNFIL